jgi:hypothetical protein
MEGIFLSGEATPGEKNSNVQRTAVKRGDGGGDQLCPGNEPRNSFT